MTRKSTTVDSISNAQIEALLRESGEAGDLETVADCRKALDGDTDARAECARVVAEAEAMIDED